MNKAVDKLIYIYNHIFFDKENTWIFILQDQLHEYERSGLYENTSGITIVAVGEQTQHDTLLQCINQYQKVKVVYYDLIDGVTQDERLTLQQIYNDSTKSDHYILYTHCKGVTAWNKYFNSNAPFFMNYYHWRKYLEWGCIERWRDCIELLETNDIAGCNFNDGPLPHYSGNMWWTTSNYVRTLDDISGNQQNLTLQEYYNNRLLAEFWPCSKATRMGSVHNPPDFLRWPNDGVYSLPWTRGMYSREI